MHLPSGVAHIELQKTDMKNKNIEAVSGIKYGRYVYPWLVKHIDDYREKE